MENFHTWYCFSDRISNLQGCVCLQTKNVTVKCSRLSYSDQSYQQPLWFVTLILQLFVGRCGRHRPLKSPQTVLGGLRLVKYGQRDQPHWNRCEKRFDMNRDRNIRKAFRASCSVWECTPYRRRRDVWLMPLSLLWSRYEEISERRGRWWLFAVDGVRPYETETLA